MNEELSVEEVKSLLAEAKKEIGRLKHRLSQVSDGADGGEDVFMCLCADV